MASSLVFGGRMVRGIARRQRMMLLERRRAERERMGAMAIQMEGVEGHPGPVSSRETILSVWAVEGGDLDVVSGVREGMGE